MPTETISPLSRFLDSILFEYIVIPGILGVGVAIRHTWNRIIRRRAKLSELNDNKNAIATLALSSNIQKTAKEIRAISGVLLFWEEGSEGGVVSVIGEWPGDKPPTSPDYNKREMKKPYREDIIDPVLLNEFCLVMTEDLTNGSTLKNLYDSESISHTWLYQFHKEMKNSELKHLIFLSFRFSKVSHKTEAEIKNEISKLGEMIKELR